MCAARTNFNWNGLPSRLRATIVGVNAWTNSVAYVLVRQSMCVPAVVDHPREDKDQG